MPHPTPEMVARGHAHAHNRPERVIHMRNLLVIGVCACVLGLAADAPYAGKWKMNVAKSDFGEMTMTYEQMAGGEMKATMEGQSYTFKMDGKDTMTPWGSTAAWKSTGANSWELTEKANGKVVSTSTLKLSADGNSMMMDSKRAKAEGGTAADSMTMQRVSGGPGLAGKWKTKNMSSNSPDTLMLTPKGADGLMITVGIEGGVCDAKFDGKSYPATGPMWPSGWTCVIARSGARGFDVAWRKDGKDMFKANISVSDDGKTLTEMSSAPGTTEKMKAVYDKQ